MKTKDDEPRAADSGPLHPEGVVTLADHNYFPGLEVLHRSVQESHPVPVLCYDIGLTARQRRRAAELEGLTVLPVPSTPEIELVRAARPDAPIAKQGKREWPIWICPFLIAESRLRRALWIDCDAVVLRDLGELFAMLDEGPVFTPENFAPEVTPNAPELYDLLPIERDFDPSLPVVNAGVSGWDLERDANCLDAYRLAARRAFEDPRIKEAISWWDQGCLVWAIQATGSEGRVVETNRWNLCAKGTRAEGRRYRWGPGVLDELRRDVPEAAILHWNGLPVPWGKGR